MKARLKDGVVVETAPDDAEFHPALGFVDAPANVTVGWRKDGDNWLEPAPPPGPTTAHVRREAARRMVALLGARDIAHMDILISNGSREAIRLLRKGGANWTDAEAARAAELEVIDAAIEAIRAASNVIEVMDPIPDDYAADERWPVMGD